MADEIELHEIERRETAPPGELPDGEEPDAGLLVRHCLIRALSYNNW